MTGAQDYRSFADPDTHFIILTSDSPVTVDGYAAGEPYGLVCFSSSSTLVEIRSVCSPMFQRSNRPNLSIMPKPRWCIVLWNVGTIKYGPIEHRTDGEVVQMSEDQSLNTDLRVRVSEKTRMEIEELAHERSEPGDTVSVSDILRDAISEYLDEAQSDE